MTQKSRQKSPSGHHHANLSGYIFATEAHIDNREKLLSSNTSSRCRHNMVNFGPLTAEIGPVVWGTPSDFNGFRVLAALLHGSQVGLVWVLVATRRSVCIHQMNRVNSRGNHGHENSTINIIGSRPSDHYFRSVCLFVCLFVQSFSLPSLIRFRSN